MKKSSILKIPLYLIFLLYFSNQVTTRAQDLEKVWEKYGPAIEKIQSEEDAKNFVLTHARNEFELNEDIMTFLVALNGGSYTKQIDYIMSVPVQKWNPLIGGGWGAYQIEDVRKVVSKNVTTAFHNVSAYATKISEGLKYYSLCNSILQALDGDNGAKLKSVHLAFEVVRDWMISDFPNMNAAILSVGFINYALDKFVNTTLDEYNEYWWNKYRDYLFSKYPGFLQNWAYPSMQGDVVKFLEGRFSEFWDSAEQFEQDAPVLYRNSEYAKNVFGPSFAARYYNEYLRQNLMAWARRNAELEEASAWMESERNTRELSELIEEIKLMKAAIEAAQKQMNEKLPSALNIVPNEVNLKAGESVQFKAIAVYDDQTANDVTELETTSWSTGSNSFTAAKDADKSEQTAITVTYMNLTAKAVVKITGNEDDKKDPCGEHQEWNAEKNRCDCIEGYEMIEELGKCVSIDEAIDGVAGEKPETACDEESMSGRLTRLQEIVAESQLKSAQFSNILTLFTKAVNEKDRNPCNDQLIATAYAGAIKMQQELQDFQDEATQLSSELIFEATLCQLNNPKFDISSMLRLVAQMGTPSRMVNQGISDMQSELMINGCDKQEVADLGNTIAETTINPELVSAMESGNIIQPPDQTPGGTMGAVAALYDGTNAQMSTANISVNFPFRTFSFTLGSNAQDVRNFENARLKEGDIMQITVYGTSLNPTITLLPTDFIWIDPETRQQTTAGNGICLFTVIIAVYFNDTPAVNRYEMIVGIGTVGFGIPGFPDGYGRELRF
jgi:hypothetical protein